MIARTNLKALLLAALVGFTFTSGPFSTFAQTSSPASQAHAAASYGKLPLSFEAYSGQAGAGVQFLSRGNGYSLFLTGQDAVLSLNSDGCAQASATRAQKATGAQKGTGDALRHSACPQPAATFRMSLAGQPNTAAIATGQEPLPGKANYFIGDDPARWQTGLATYAQVRYAEVYPGIDLLYHGNQRQLEYDFVVGPRANPRQIQLHFEGIEKLRVDAHGNLVLFGKRGQIAFHKPSIYQQIDGRRHAVAGSFLVQNHHTVGFALGRYRLAQPLIIDPVLAYSTFLGGTSTGGDSATAIAVDASGNAYVTGQASSANFPVTAGALQQTNAAAANSTFNAFISKLNPGGTALVYSTYIGGSLNTRANSIALDSAGNAYITGSTFASNFPTTAGAFQTASKANASGFNAFVAKLNAQGSALIYSTYLGGSGSGSGTGDMGNAIAVDGSGDAYVAGTAYSANFPTTAGAFQTTNHAAANNSYDAFVTRLNSTGTALAYSTLLGGSGTGLNGEGDAAYALALDGAGNVYVAGATASANFPTTAGAYQVTSLSTPLTQTSVFVTKLNPAGSAPVYSTLIGGTSNSGGYALALDVSGDAYVAGAASSSDFPTTPGVFQSVNNAAAISASNAFVAKLDPTGSRLVYSTWLGGSGLQKTFFIKSGDTADALAVDAAGNAYVAGTAFSTNFPVTAGTFQATNYAAADKTSNAFFAELNPTASALVYSTYIGGAGAPVGTSGNFAGDNAAGIALDATGGVYIAGLAESTNYPVTVGAFQISNHGAGTAAANAFITKFSSAATTITSLASSANPQNAGSPVTFTATVSPTSGTAVPTGNVVFLVDSSNVATVSLNASAQASYSTSALAAGTHSVVALYGGSLSFGGSTSTTLTESIKSAITQAAVPTFTPAAGIYTSSRSVTLADTTAGATIYYTTGGATPTTSSPKYTGPIAVSKTTTVRAIAVAMGYTNSAVASATYTIAVAPTVASKAATGLTTSGATLNGTVTANNSATQYWFAYGTSQTSLTSTTTKTGSLTGTTPSSVTATLTGLKTKTKYYFKAVASNVVGTKTGSVLSFTTN